MSKLPNDKKFDKILVINSKNKNKIITKLNRKPIYLINLQKFFNKNISYLLLFRFVLVFLF